jgi:hypothetical protein
LSAEALFMAELKVSDEGVDRGCACADLDTITLHSQSMRLVVRMPIARWGY